MPRRATTAAVILGDGGILPQYLSLTRLRWLAWSASNVRGRSRTFLWRIVDDLDEGKYYNANAEKRDKDIRTRLRKGFNQIKSMIALCIGYIKYRMQECRPNFLFFATGLLLFPLDCFSFFYSLTHNHVYAFMVISQRVGSTSRNRHRHAVTEHAQTPKYRQDG